MSRHLTPVEFVDAAEGALGAGRLAHLTECAACRAEVEGLRGLGAAIKASRPAAEPSPLFWDHFSERVRQAARAEAAPAATGWRESWRPFLALAAVGLTAIVLALQVRPPRMSAPAGGVAGVGSGVATAFAEGQPASEPDEAFAFVVQAAAQVPFAELQQSSVPTSDATDAALDQLSEAQRAELVRLLKARIAGEE